VVGTKGNKGFVKGIMEVVKGRKVHWLGFTNKEFIKYYRPYSCDSSAMKTAERFATLEIFDEKTGLWYKMSKSDFAKRPSKKILDLINTYNMNPRDFALEEKWKGGYSVSSYLSYKSHIRASLRYHEKLNTKYFLAAIAHAPVVSIEKLISTYEEELNRL